MAQRDHNRVSLVALVVIPLIISRALMVPAGELPRLTVQPLAPWRAMGQVLSQGRNQDQGLNQGLNQVLKPAARQELNQAPSQAARQEQAAHQVGS